MLSFAVALLSFTAGMIDGASFLSLGHVFTSAMSGNTIVFGLAVGGGDLLAGTRSLTAFAGFVAGLVVGSLIAEALPPKPRVLVMLTLETIVLTAFGALWISVGSTEPAIVYVLIGMSALAMGLQANAARSLHVLGVNTVVFTSTLGSIVQGLVGRGAADEAVPPVARPTAAFTFYLAGALLIGVAHHAAPLGLSMARTSALPAVAVIFALGALALRSKADFG